MAQEQSAPQSPEAREKHKSEREKAEDVAYTINHALVCATTDVIDPFVAAWSQRYLGIKLNTSFCNQTHDHIHDDHHHHHHHGHDHHHHDHALSFGGALKHWVIGEAIGDIGAVPVTIAFQRLAPNVMARTGRAMEMVLGGFYWKGAQAAAQRYAAREGLAPDAPEVQNKAVETYRHEVDHFGQAAVWTVASIGLNIASQKYITGNRLPLGHMLLYKSLGAGMSAGLLIGGRAYSPETFENWDQWTSDKVFMPISRVLTGTSAPSSRVDDTKWMNRVQDDAKDITHIR